MIEAGKKIKCPRLEKNNDYSIVVLKSKDLRLESSSSYILYHKEIKIKCAIFLGAVKSSKATRTKSTRPSYLKLFKRGC